MFTLNFTGWILWASLAVGVAASTLAAAPAVLYGRWRRRLTTASTEEDLPWDEVLELLRRRGTEQAAAGKAPDDLPPDELLKELLAHLHTRPRPRARVDAKQPEFGVGGIERRANARRWGNPVEVLLSYPFWPGPVLGVVINRSTGGLAVFVDHDLPEGARLMVRSVEAPRVRAVEVEVRHCRKVGTQFFLGCQFCDDVPWNVRVWLG